VVLHGYFWKPALDVILSIYEFKAIIDESCCDILVNKDAKNASENICKNIHPFSTSVRNKMLVKFVTYPVQGGRQYAEHYKQVELVSDSQCLICPEKEGSKNCICGKMKQLVCVWQLRNTFN